MKQKKNTNYLRYKIVNYNIFTKGHDARSGVFLGDRVTKECTAYQICIRVTAFSDLFCFLLITENHSWELPVVLYSLVQ